MDIDWKAPWRAVYEKESRGIWGELNREIGKGHSLFGHGYDVIGRRDDNDDVLLYVDRAVEPWAVVHVTFSGKEEGDARFPWTQYYGNVDEALKDI